MVVVIAVNIPMNRMGRRMEGHRGKYTGAQSSTGRESNRGISKATVQVAIRFAASVME